MSRAAVRITKFKAILLSLTALCLLMLSVQQLAADYFKQKGKRYCSLVDSANTERLLEKGIQAYSNGIAVTRKDSELYYQRARAQWKLDRTKITRILSDMKKAVYYCPPLSLNYAFLAVIYGEMGESLEAKKYLSWAVQLNSANDRYHFLLGSIYWSHNQEEAALNEFKKALRWGYSDNYSKIINLGGAKLLLRSLPKNSKDFLLAAHYLDVNEMTSDAFQAHLIAVKLAESEGKDQRVKAIMSLAHYYSAHGDHLNAARWGSAALNIDSKNLDIIYFCGKEYFRAKKYIKACQLFTKMNEMEPADKRAARFLNKCKSLNELTVSAKVR